MNSDGRSSPAPSHAPRGGRTATAPIATFLGGCVPASQNEEVLAYEAGFHLGRLGFTLHHGGYNGLMESAARGAAAAGARVVAVTLAGKEEWGAFNPHVNEAIHAPDMGERLTHLVSRADVIVAMGGGVGSVHELTAALWYAGNVRRVPVVAVGPTVIRLLKFLRQERWLYESPTRPLDFLHCVLTAVELSHVLRTLSAGGQPAVDPREPSLEARIQHAAYVRGAYQLADGRVLAEYFDPFRLAADPALSADLAAAMASRVTNSVDVVAGLALGGVVLATNLAGALRRPLLLVRPQPKTYGTFAQLEGLGRRGQEALIVDDVIRSGRQVLEAARVLADAGLHVRMVMCVLERSGPGRALLAKHGISLHSVMRDGGCADEAPRCKHAERPHA